MRRNLKILFSVAIAGFCLPEVQAIVPEATKDQYQAIPERNAFALRQPPSQPLATNTPAALPKITLTGITTILDNKRALMKVAPANAKQVVDPTKELSLILTEGQREGDIEVLQIDEKAGSVKVNNSGTVMVLTFEKDGAKLPATAPPSGAPGGIPVPTALPRGQATNPFALPARGTPGALPTRNPRFATPPIPGVATANPPVGGVPTPTGATPAPGQGATSPAGAQDLTAEEQAIVMEIQRQANTSTSALLPPTPLTPTPASPQPAGTAPTANPANSAIPGRPLVLVPQ